LVVPEGASISESGGLCVASSASPTVRQLITITAASTPVDIQAASVAYELKLTDLLGAGTWQLDPSWTYPAPLVRFDGLTARRKGSLKWVMSPLGPTADTYAFETLAAKGGLFMGVTAIRTGITVEKLQQQQQCMALPTLAQCAAIRAELRQLALANMATSLSTFPIG